MNFTAVTRDCANVAAQEIHDSAAHDVVWGEYFLLILAMALFFRLAGLARIMIMMRPTRAAVPAGAPTVAPNATERSALLGMAHS